MNEILRNVNIERPLGDYIYPKILPPSVKLDIPIATINEMRKDSTVIENYKKQLIDYRADLQDHLSTSQRSIQILYDKLVDYFVKQINVYIKNVKESDILVKSVLKSPEKVKDTDAETLLHGLINIVNDTINKKYSVIHDNLLKIFTKFVEIPGQSNSVVYIQNPVAHRGKLKEFEPNSYNDKIPRDTEDNEVLGPMIGGDNTDLNYIIKVLNEEGITSKGRKHTKNELASFKLSRPINEKVKWLQPKLDYFKSKAINPTPFGVNNRNNTKFDEKLLIIIEQIQDAIIKYIELIKLISTNITIINKTLTQIESREGKPFPPQMNISVKKLREPVLGAVKDDLDKYKKSLVTEKTPYAIKDSNIESYKNRLRSIISDILSNSFYSQLDKIDETKLVDIFTDYVIKNKNIHIEKSINRYWKDLMIKSSKIVANNKEKPIAEIQNILLKDFGFTIKNPGGIFINIAENDTRLPQNENTIIDRIDSLIDIEANITETLKKEANDILEGLRKANIIEREYINKNLYDRTTQKIKNINNELAARNNGSTRIRNTRRNIRNTREIRYGTAQQPSQSWWSRIFTRKKSPKKGIVWRNIAPNSPSSIANIQSFPKNKPTTYVKSHSNVTPKTTPTSILKQSAPAMPTPTRKWYQFWKRSGGRNTTRKLRK